MVGLFSKLYIGQAVGGELDLMVLVGRMDERAAVQWDRILKVNWKAACSSAPPISIIKSNLLPTACPK
jgi:hypothetical protein